MKKQSKKQLYVIRKYVMASSVMDAIKKERSIPVQDVWLDDDFKKNQIQAKDCIGFKIEEYE